MSVVHTGSKKNVIHYPPLNAPNTSTSLQLPWHRCQHGFEILHCTPWRHRSSSTTKGVKLQWIYRYHVLWPGNITTNSTLANWMCFLLQVWKGQKNWRTRYVRVVSPELNEGMEPTSRWAWSIMICLKRKYLLILVYWYAYLLSLRYNVSYTNNMINAVWTYSKCIIQQRYFV